jgi:hypothetical protein
MFRIEFPTTQSNQAKQEWQKVGVHNATQEESVCMEETG